MIVITRQMNANKAARRWVENFKNQNMILQAEKISSLGNKPDPDELDKILGNDTWTWVECDECNSRVESAVEFYDSPGSNLSDENEFVCPKIIICDSCLKEAVEKLEKK